MTAHRFVYEVDLRAVVETYADTAQDAARSVERVFNAATPDLTLGHESRGQVKVVILTLNEQEDAEPIRKLSTDGQETD